MRLGDLAAALGCRLEGDAAAEILRVRPLEEAGEGDLAFAADARRAGALEACRASAVILPPGPPRPRGAALRTPNPYLAFARALTLLLPDERPAPGIDPTAAVAPGAQLAPGVAVGPLAVIEEGAVVGEGTVVGPLVSIGRRAVVGRGCRLDPHAVLLPDVVVGDRVIIGPGAVIGGDGFGYAKDGSRYVKIPQRGRVVLEDDVEVGANATIDRATLGETRIGRGTKVDNLVIVAHNVRIGADCIIVGQAGISGSTTVGARVTLAAQAGIVGHVRIGDDVTVGGQSGVTKDIPAGSVVLGSPAAPHMVFKRGVAAVNRLPALHQAVRRLEERLRRLEARLGSPEPKGDNP